ncbi:hypothetical protein KL907_004566 [Ogataea polymorpha]|nr:hypothetical protein KL907_004566 [Ogataea polymorpha]
MSSITDPYGGPSEHNQSGKTRRIVSLVFSCLVAMASGTPYLFGIYSPQVMSRCHFTAEDASLLTFGSTLGSSIGGLAAGLLIDRFGPKFAIFLGAILESGAFVILYLTYRFQLHHLWLLEIAMANVGFGSVLPYFATLKVATINFPKHKGMANACPVSAYGLAALMYASISTVFYAGDTQGLLKFIAIFSGVVIGLGCFFIDIHEPDEIGRPAQDEPSGIKYLLKGHRGSFAQLNLVRRSSNSSLFSSTSEISSLSVSTTSSGTSTITNKPISITSAQNKSPYSSRPSSYSPISSSPVDVKTKQSLARANSYRLGSSLSNSPRNPGWLGNAIKKNIKEEAVVDEDSPLNPGSDSYSASILSLPQSQHSEVLETTPADELIDATKRKKNSHRTSKEHIQWLFNNRTFLCHYVLNALFCGSGQVYIYGVGYIVKAQMNKNPNFTSDQISSYQALQVSLISLCNFLGRILGGIFSDYLHKSMNSQRLWVIVVSVVCGILGNVTLLLFDNARFLSLTSTCFGLSYGAIYGAMPAIVADNFGAKHFATSWSVIGTGSVVAFLMLSDFFGKDYDKHSQYLEDGDGKLVRMCLKGNRCYENVFGINLFIGCILLVSYCAMIYCARKK